MGVTSQIDKNVKLLIQNSSNMLDDGTFILLIEKP